MGISTHILIARRKAEAEAREAERRAEAGEAVEAEATTPEDADALAQAAWGPDEGTP